MSQPRRDLLISVLFMITLILLSGGMGVYVLSDTSLHASLTMAKTAQKIHERANGEFDWDYMFQLGVKAMTDRLDRYSFYIESSRFQQMDEELTGSYGGIGVSVIPHDLGVMIISVREHGPSSDAGLLSGDIIIGADSIILAGLSPNECTDLLRGENGSHVNVTVFRPETLDTIKVDVTRSQIELLHIPYAGITSDSLIYIRLIDFEAGAAEDVEAALDSLLDKNGQWVTGILLDLRGNPGGLFSEAFSTANLFLDDGQFIVGTDGRSRWRDREYYSDGEDKTNNLPLAVLVDRGSASASEIVAGSFKQLGRAILVGDTTFGKGLVQGFSDYSDGSGLRLTVSRYFLEGDIYLNEFDSSLNDVGHGIVPDYYFKSTDRNHFPRSLENSLLLQKFATSHQKEIIETGSEFSLGSDWINRFEQFATENEYRYMAPSTAIAHYMVELSLLTDHDDRTVSATKRVLTLSQQNDSSLFEEYGDFIRMRIQQLAWERQYGLSRTYADVIVPNLAEIRNASELLRVSR